MPYSEATTAQVPVGEVVLSQKPSKPRVVIVGGGPAGLMAAQALAESGLAGQACDIHVYDAMPSMGRKFLLAGLGGLNLTHSEPYAQFIRRYGEPQPGSEAPTGAGLWESVIDGMPPSAVCAWAEQLGVSTFVGSSGRVFPTEMKAAPLLRAWLRHLRALGVQLHVRHRWLGWADAAASKPGTLVFATPAGRTEVEADATILALGGGSWPQLGSDGAWMPILAERAIATRALRSANCGFNGDWSAYLRERHAGAPLKSIALSLRRDGELQPPRRGEMVLTQYGLEGSLIYAMSRAIRETIEASGVAELSLDLMPDWTSERLASTLAAARGAKSWSSHLQSRLGLRGVKLALLQECVPPADWQAAQQSPLALVPWIKALPIKLKEPRPLAEAISTAGGVSLPGLNRDLMVERVPGLFCAGEMLDWEAPTGGYLLTGCLASGRAAGLGARNWLVIQGWWPSAAG